MADTTQVKELTAKLERGIQDLFSSETYASYLKTMSRFHTYSTRNTLLIHMQKPDASYVTGFRSWQTKFGRYVKKGEKSISILAPVPFTKREEREKLDPDTRQPVLDEDGMPVIEYTERQLARFKSVKVFDVSQTDGKPLPSLAQDLVGSVEQYEAFMDALREVSPLPIVFEAMEEGKDGYCRFGEKIAVREGMSQIQTVCAAIHEITHAKLHDKESLRLVDENAKPKDRRTQEVEAESVAFSVSSFFNIETGANSFGYIAEWSRGRELKELNASLDTIRKTTAELIDAIDGRFREIAKDRDINFAIGEQQAELAGQEPVAAIHAAANSPESAQTAANLTPETPVRETAGSQKDAAMGHTLYEKFAALFPDFADGKYSYMRLEAGSGMEPLSLEWFFGDRISVMHTYQLNGDLCYDPMMEFMINGSGKTMAARSYEQSIPPIYQFFDDDGIGKSVDGNGRETTVRALQSKLDGFASQWLDNIAEQGYMPVRAKMELDKDGNISRDGLITDITVEVSFSADGSPIFPDNAAGVTEAQEQKPRYIPGYDDDGKFIRQFAILNVYVKDVSAELKANDVKFTFADGNTDYLTFFVIPNEDDAGRCRDALDKLGVENLFNVPESELKPLSEAAYRQTAEKEYDLGYGFLGNGLTVWNRAEERDNDFVTVAHIAPDRSVTFYDKDMPHEVKQRIDAAANSPGTWAMGFSPAPENIPPQIEGAAATASVYETVKRVMHETEALSPALSPDPETTIAAMREYGYMDADGIMLPLSESWALQLFDSNTTVYLLYPDDTEAMALDRADIENHGGIFGIDASDWKQTPEYAAKKAAAKNAEGKREADLLYGNNHNHPENIFGIYQIRSDIDEARNFRFAPLREMEALSLPIDRANYELVYTAPLTERVEFLSDRYPVLNRIYEDFNVNRPADFAGHSLSVSDVVVLRCNGDISTHYCDSAGFAELDSHAFYGEETQKAPVAEAPAQESALSQLGTRQEGYAGASAAELEADVKSGIAISLLALSKALSAEQKSGKEHIAAPKTRPTLMERLEAGKRKAAAQGQTEAQKNKEREVRE